MTSVGTHLCFKNGFRCPSQSESAMFGFTCSFQSYFGILIIGCVMIAFPGVLCLLCRSQNPSSFRILSMWLAALGNGMFIGICSQDQMARVERDDWSNERSPIFEGSEIMSIYGCTSFSHSQTVPRCSNADLRICRPISPFSISEWRM